MLQLMDLHQILMISNILINIKELEYILEVIQVIVLIVDHKI